MYSPVYQLVCHVDVLRGSQSIPLDGKGPFPGGGARTCPRSHNDLGIGAVAH